MPQKTQDKNRSKSAQAPSLPADAAEATVNYKDWHFVKDLSEHEPPFSALQQPGKGSTVTFGAIHPELITPVLTAYLRLGQYILASGYTPTLAEDADHCIELDQCYTSAIEEYVITVKGKNVLIAAYDSEGLRRGIYAFMDMLAAHGGRFPSRPCRVSGKPFLNVRLAKSPWGLVKRWPLNQDELLCDDIEFYPFALLDRFAHDAINAVWLVASLRDVGRCSFCPPSPDRERRIKKLKELIHKTGLFGIKIYLFMIEPFALEGDDPILLAHPSMKGPKAYNGRYTLCPDSPDTKRYLTELITDIFTELPELGGILNITLGERPSSCLSTLPLAVPGKLECQGRCGLNPGEILHKLLATMNSAIHAASPDANLIAWFYMPHAAKHQPWVETLMDYVPDDVIAQLNFESGGEKKQFGVVRKGVDYWLPYDGPGAPFINAARRREGKEMSAKLQLGCGYDMAIVPFIPAPGIAYRKYKAMSELGVNNVMQAWYPGNFPGTMTNAMGLLAFTDFKNETEDQFLLRLASIYWGSDAKCVVKAWKHFDKGYQNFPFNVNFQYYSPLNSAPLWKLNVFPDLEPLAPPWKPTFKIGGDAIGEALGNFSLDNVIDLLWDMRTEWTEGYKLLNGLRAKYKDYYPRIEDINLAAFIGLMITNTFNICLFYACRKELYLLDNKALLGKMRECATSYIEVNEFLAKYQKEDSRLGFHGEALHYVFDETSIKENNRYAKGMLKVIGDMEKSPLAPTEYLKKHTNYTYIFPNTLYKDAFAEDLPLKWRYTLHYGKLNLHFELPRKLGKMTFIVYFMEMYGTYGEHMEFFELDMQNETITFLNTGRDVTDGVKYKSAASQISVKGGTVSITYPLANLTFLHHEDMQVRFNAAFVSQGDAPLQKLLFGKPYPARLYKSFISPQDCAVMDLPATPYSRSSDYNEWKSIEDVFNMIHQEQQQLRQQQKQQ